VRPGLLGLLILASTSRHSGQGQVSWAGPPLFILDVQGTALDEFPSGVKALNGTMTVVDKNGQRMLRASSPSEFLITLPQNLPAAFTVVVDLIPKACCNPEDFMLEGTPTRNRGVASAELTWHPEHIMAVGGGGEMYQSDMPADLAASTPGNLTQLVWEFSGTTIKLYTNGRRMYTLDKQFARGRVLRVWLGGQDEGLHAVHLAGLSVLDGAVAAGVIAATAGLPGGGAVSSNPQVNSATSLSSTRLAGRAGGSTGTGSGTATQQSASTGGALPTVVSNVSVAQGTSGPVVNWLPVSVPAVYSVRRWKIDDQTCCNNASPPTPALNGPPWQDAPLPVAGTYVYEVTATMSGGVASGQAQFIKLTTGGHIAVAAPPPAPPPPVVSAPIATVSGLAGSSTLVFGPATLTATPRQGWGVVLDWPEVVNGQYYLVERGPTNQSFGLFTTIVPTIRPPKAGSFFLDDVTMLPGSTSFYRIKVDFPDGTFAYSPIARFDAPTQVAQATNLTVSRRGPCDVSSPFGGCTPPAPNSTSIQYWLLTWSWVPAPGVLTQDYRDEFLEDPSKGFVVSLGGTWYAGNPPSYQQSYPIGFIKQVRFCISVVRPMMGADPITNGTCLVADIP
jgi:hypothetical protein